MAMPAIRRRWTVEDVRALIREDRAWPRYELIDDELIVTPAPQLIHQGLASELWLQLRVWLDRSGIGMAYTAPADIELRPGTITQPDVFVIPAGLTPRGDVLEWSDVTRLLLAVEILSPASQRTDRITKRDFYLDTGVAEYWIVDPDARMVESWRPQQDRPVLHRGILRWDPPRPTVGGEALAIDLPALFAQEFRRARGLPPIPGPVAGEPRVAPAGEGSAP